MKEIESVLMTTTHCTKQPRLKVLHIITDLVVGGANMMLYKLLQHLDNERFECKVVTLLEEEVLEKRIRELGVEVINLNGKRGKLPGLQVWWGLRKVTKTFQPDILQGWMYHGNVATSFAKCFCPGTTREIWNVRHSLHDITCETRITRWTIRLNGWLSGRPDVILYNSDVSRKQHETAGYKGVQGCVIPNGFDTGRFRLDPAAKQQFRDELGVGSATKLVTIMGRLHPMKGHEVFLDMAVKLAEKIQDVRFVVVGRPDVISEQDLQQLIVDRGLGEQVHFTGGRENVEMIHAASDLLVCASRWGEGFPNVIGEAMACGTLVVTTDVGDCARVVGETGWVVPVDKPGVLAEACRKVLELPEDTRQKKERAVRERVVKHYSIERITKQYADLYVRLSNSGMGKGLSENQWQ
jgi:glycosyltransferase involved in cell wall biosynthesis